MKKDIMTALHESQARQSKQSRGMLPDPSEFISAIQESLSRLAQAAQAVIQEDVVLQRLWFTELESRERTVEMPHERTFRWLLYDSRLEDSRFQDSEEKGQSTKPVTIGVSSFAQDACSNQSADSNEDNDAVSFRTAPDEEYHNGSDALEDTEAGSRSSSSEYSLAQQIESKHSRQVLRQQRVWRNEKRESFLNWLRNENGIFYCSGKAGSGKSTLMKFLAHDTRTRDELSFWSRTQGKTLILASFFFWSSGRPLQRNIEGLYRAILWEVLRKCPSLVPVVFPATWSSAGFGQPSVTHQPFTMGELESAMNRLFSDEMVTSSHSLCLFLDGLDEYEGDYWKFAKAISRWAASSKDIKFCLSSRPHGAFLRHFALDETRHLRLHELTRADMYRFVSDQFREDERYTAIEDDMRQRLDLLSAIVDRSDGVFLWVRLVTVELLSGMGDHCSIPQLLKRLRSIPIGLKNMVQKMLDSIDRTEQQRAAQMFLTMTHGSTLNSYFSMIVFIQAILDDLVDNPGLAVSLLSANVGPYLSSADCIAKCHIAGPRAIARCKGLVEVTHSGYKFPYCHQLNFVHRTVGDFFKDKKTELRLKSAAGDFCDHRSLSHAVLAIVKFINPDESVECPEYATTVKTTAVSDSWSSKFIEFRRPGPVSQMQDFLAIIGYAEFDGIPPMAVEVDSMISMLRQTFEHDHNGGRAYIFPRPVFDLEDVPCWHWGPIATRFVDSAVVSYGICIEGLTETAIEVISNHPELLELSPGKHHLFLSAALRDLYDVYLGIDISRTRMLIERASSSINADCSERCKIGELDEDIARRQIIGLQFSTWTTFLLALSQLMGPSQPSFRNNLTGTRVATLLDLFLQHGADPDVVFIGYSFATPTDDVGTTRPKGPLYMDLLEMMTFWKLAPTKSTEHMLNFARHKQRQGWLRRSLSQFAWVGRRTQVAYERMSQFDNNCGGDFIPLSIIPRGSLESVSWEALQDIADWVFEHGSENFEFSFYV